MGFKRTRLSLKGAARRSGAAPFRLNFLRQAKLPPSSVTIIKMCNLFYSFFHFSSSAFGHPARKLCDCFVTEAVV